MCYSHTLCYYICLLMQAKCSFEVHCNIWLDLIISVIWCLFINSKIISLLLIKTRKLVWWNFIVHRRHLESYGNYYFFVVLGQWKPFSSHIYCTKKIVCCLSYLIANSYLFLRFLETGLCVRSGLDGLGEGVDFPTLHLHLHHCRILDLVGSSYAIISGFLDVIEV